VEKGFQYVVDCHEYAASNEYKSQNHCIVACLHPGLFVLAAVIWFVGEYSSGLSTVAGRRRGKPIQYCGRKYGG